MNEKDKAHYEERYEEMKEEFNKIINLNRQLEDQNLIQDVYLYDAKLTISKMRKLISLAEDIVTANGWEGESIPKHIKARRDAYLKEWNND